MTPTQGRAPRDQLLKALELARALVKERRRADELPEAGHVNLLIQQVGIAAALNIDIEFRMVDATAGSQAMNDALQQRPGFPVLQVAKPAGALTQPGDEFSRQRFNALRVGEGNGRPALFEGATDAAIETKLTRNLPSSAPLRQLEQI